MNDDLSIKWTLANPLSIQTDDTGNAWNSVAARDIASMSEDKVLVATDTGSIWMAGRDGSSITAIRLSSGWNKQRHSTGHVHLEKGAGARRRYNGLSWLSRRSSRKRRD